MLFVSSRLGIYRCTALLFSASGNWVKQKNSKFYSNVGFVCRSRFVSMFQLRSCRFYTQKFMFSVWICLACSGAGLSLCPPSTVQSVADTVPFQSGLAHEESPIVFKRECCFRSYLLLELSPLLGARQRVEFPGTLRRRHTPTTAAARAGRSTARRASVLLSGAPKSPANNTSSGRRIRLGLLTWPDVTEAPAPLRKHEHVPATRCCLVGFHLVAFAARLKDVKVTHVRHLRRARNVLDSRTIVHVRLDNLKIRDGGIPNVRTLRSLSRVEKKNIARGSN